MKKSIVYLGIALVSFINVSMANETTTSVSSAKIENVYGNTPLCVAISKGDLEVVKKFVEYGADINEKSNGMTPLMIAARYNNVQITEYLLSKGAKADEKSENGFTALRWAEASGAKEVAAVLAKA
ncbi:MAG: ankyrin repeat domain-containing protein [Flavobacterium sp.]|uniref:ankyrin repeat domain-containing protein n=1 Tax=Flavobacterium sp. TaxID=239 RepID=UPI0012033485|nr:ankyrin repeat domain-containing protein [Flavobacterium sp.]RZJ66134.1 MAG: ankyrin repeat domain-containing protein [Flavobacterium sp.]